MLKERFDIFAGCSKCPQQYIRETERMLKERFAEHKGYVTSNNQTETTGKHFNQRGHNVSNIQITVIKKIFNQDPHFKKQRESV